MSYVAQALVPGETVRAVGRVHWILWLRAIGALVLLGIILVGVVIFFRQLALNISTEIAVTNRRLIFKTGLLQRHAVEINLSSIESVNVDQDVLGRLLNYGRVSVHGTGDDKYTTPLIANPAKFVREIEMAEK